MCENPNRVCYHATTTTENSNTSRQIEREIRLKIDSSRVSRQDVLCILQSVRQPLDAAQRDTGGMPEGCGRDTGGRDTDGCDITKRCFSTQITCNMLYRSSVVINRSMHNIHKNRCPSHISLMLSSMATISWKLVQVQQKQH